MSNVLLASLVLLAAGITGAFADEPSQDRSTWRWATAKALEAQQGSQSSTLASQDEFTQRYERYSYNGQIEAPR